MSRSLPSVPHVRLLSALVSGLAAASLSACAGGPPAAGDVAPPPAFETASKALDSMVSVARIAPGLWMHVTLSPTSGYPSNGMLLETDEGSVLFDTAWDDRQTALLLAWAASDLRKPVRRAIVTHSHNDRLGGLGALRRAGVPAVALGETVQRAAKEGVLAAATGGPTPGGGSEPAPALDSIAGLTRAAKRDAAGFELFYPGAGHAPDNIVVYFPGARVLFGGCLVKPDTATTTGNVADADVAEWPRAVSRVEARYPDVRTVVPGHGAVSPRSALAVTQTLIAEKGPAAVEALRRSQRRPQ